MSPWTVPAGVSVLAAFCVYYNSLPAGFVYDDSRVILSNPDVLPSTPLEALFTNDFWGTPIKSPSSHGSYRPLCILTYRLNYLWAGFKPFSYHLVNVLLHCLCTWLVHLLGTRVLPRPASAWVASGLFGVHPVHTEAVAGLVGRADILSAIFFLLAVLVFIYLPPRNMLRYLSVTLLGACAMLSKEIGVSAVLICIVWDIACQPRGSNTQKTRRSWRSTILLALSFIMLLCVRIMIMGASSPSFSKADNPTARHPSFVTRTLTFLYLPLLNLQLLMYPQQLSYDWGMEAIRPVENIYDMRNLLTILLYSILSYMGVSLAKFLLAKNNRQWMKSSKALPSKMNKVCDNLEVMCNYCKFRRRSNESRSQSVEEKDLNNNVIGKEGFNMNYNFIDSTKANDVASNLERKQWDSKCFQYESVIEIYIKKLCLALMSVYMYSAHKNYENIPFKSRQSKNLNTLHDEYFIKESEECFPEKHKATFLHTVTKPKLSSNNKKIAKEVNTKIEKIKVQNLSDSKLSQNNGTSPFLRESQRNRTCSCSKPQTISKSPPKLKHEERLAVILALLVIPCIPASNLFFYVGFVLAERVLYIPSVGYCLLVACAHSWCLDRIRSKRMLVNAVFVSLMLIFSLRTVRRNVDWLTEENLYRSGIAVNPPKSYGNLGSILSSQRRYSEAEEAYRLALSYRPNMADVHYNLGILLQGQDRTEEAIASYKKAIFYRPSLALAYLNLGQLLTTLGQCDTAAVIFRQCAELDGTGLKDPKTHEMARITALLHLGRLHGDRKRYTAAVAVYREALQRMPPYYQPSMLYSLLGEALTHLGRHADAEKMYQAALKAQPDHVASHLTYGKLLAKNRTRVAEAEVWFRKAQKLAPGDTNVYQHYGQFLSELGRYQEAIPLYTKATELSPADYDCTVGLATALRHCNRLDEAERFYRRAAKLRPLDAGSHSNLGAILHLNRKLDEAETSYAESLRLQPRGNTAQQNLRKLQALKSVAIT